MLRSTSLPIFSLTWVSYLCLSTLSIPGALCSFWCLCCAIRFCSLTLCIRFCTFAYRLDWLLILIEFVSIWFDLLCHTCFFFENDYLLSPSLHLLSQTSQLLWDSPTSDRPSDFLRTLCTSIFLPQLRNPSDLPGMHKIPCILATPSDPGGISSFSPNKSADAVCCNNDCIDFR